MAIDYRTLTAEEAEELATAARHDAAIEAIREALAAGVQEGKILRLAQGVAGAAAAAQFSDALAKAAAEATAARTSADHKIVAAKLDGETVADVEQQWLRTYLAGLEREHAAHLAKAPLSAESANAVVVIEAAWAETAERLDAIG